MTRKHFILIAHAIRKSIPDLATRRALAAALLPALCACNPRFDAERFMDAVERKKDDKVQNLPVPTIH